MSSRVRFEILFVVTVGLIIGLGYGNLWFSVGRKLAKVEAENARKEIIRCASEISSQVFLIDTVCSDWAVRPEIHRLAQMGGGGNENVLSLSRFAQRSVSFIFVLNKRGEVQYTRSVDPASQETVRFREFSDTSWPTSHHLVAPTAKGSSANGLLLTTRGPVLVSSHPIRGNGGEPGDSVGTLVIGRLLDSDLLGRIKARTRIAFQVWPVTQVDLPEDAREFLNRDPDINRPYIDDDGSNEFVRAFVTYPDIFGNAALLLSADIQRGLMGQLMAAPRKGMLLQLGVGVVALVLLILMFRRTITEPVAKLAEYCKAAIESGARSTWVPSEGGSHVDDIATLVGRMRDQFGRDMKASEKTVETLRESEERLSLALEGADVGVWEWNVRTDKITFSSRWHSILGDEDTETVGDRDDWLKRINPDDRAHVENALKAHLEGESTELIMEHRIKHKDGTDRWVLCRGLVVRNDQDKPIRVLGTQIDITTQKLGEEKLAHDAFHDALTGLPNRTLFFDRLEQEVARLERKRDYRFGVLFIDLDRFKVINDGLGHAVGDGLLKGVAARLSSRIRATDTVGRCEQTVARFGGDEFVVLLEDIGDVRDAIRVADRIHHVVSEPLMIDGHEVFTTASIGIATSGAPDTSVEQLMRHADTAMYRAKSEGGNRYAVFDISMGINAKKRLQMETYLRRAIEDEEFTVHYQPIVSLETGKIKSLEALVRWEHSELGLVPTEEFIKIAEETGMITRIGYYVVKTACRQAHDWQTMFPHFSDLDMCVNLSVKEIEEPNIVEMLREFTDEAKLEPRHLNVEITESTIMSNFEIVSEIVHSLKAMDIKLSIDDFGTGYSSLSYLHRVAADVVKIDLSFVATVHTSPETLQLVKTIVALAKNLKLEVVAEGIENEEQLELLRELGCEFGQGYLFSRPLDTAAMTDLLESDPKW